MGKTAPGISKWALTIGGIADFGGRVTVWCDTCRSHRELDLPALIEVVGRDYSLVDRRCRCRMHPGCIGWNMFRYASGPNSPMWNMATQEGIERRIERDYAARQALAAGIRDHRQYLEDKHRRERR